MVVGRQCTLQDTILSASLASDTHNHVPGVCDVIAEHGEHEHMISRAGSSSCGYAIITA
jgi:hypothetical protein